MGVNRGVPHGGTQLSKKGDVDSEDVAAVVAVRDTGITGDEGDVGDVGGVVVGAAVGGDV